MHHLLSMICSLIVPKLTEKKRPRQEASNLEYISQRELPVGDLSCMSGLIIRRLSIGRSRNYKACFISPLQSPDTCFLILFFENSQYSLTTTILLDDGVILLWYSISLCLLPWFAQSISFPQPGVWHVAFRLPIEFRYTVASAPHFGHCKKEGPQILWFILFLLLHCITLHAANSEHFEWSYCEI